MSWQIEMQDDEHYLVLSGDPGSERQLIGSIVYKRIGATWRVEIMWSGPGGDYVFESMDRVATFGFVRGVEAAQSKLLTRTSAVPGTIDPLED